MEQPLGKQLRYRRRAAGISMAAVASELGCTLNFVSLVECGRRKIPDPAWVGRYYGALVAINAKRSDAVGADFARDE